MNEFQTSNYDEENNQIVRFEELIGSIKPYIEGLEIKNAIPRIIIGIRSYFLSLGESKTKIKEYKNTGEAMNLDITKQLPEINAEIKLADAQIAIAIKDETIIVYQYIEGTGWFALVEASR